MKHTNVEIKSRCERNKKEIFEIMFYGFHTEENQGK